MQEAGPESNISKKQRFPLWVIIVIAVVGIAVAAIVIASAAGGNKTKKVTEQLALARKQKIIRVIQIQLLLHQN